MTHLFKISTPFSDMFISYVIDDTITYEVRGKDDGKLLEPKRTSKFSLGSDGNIHFDNRFIPVGYVLLIWLTLYKDRCPPPPLALRSPAESERLPLLTD